MDYMEPEDDFVYHLTSKDYLDSILEKGLIPRRRKVEWQFNAISEELKTDTEDKIFLLPRLNYDIMVSFISEWWHGGKEKILLMKIPKSDVVQLTHPNSERARNWECWTKNPIPMTNVTFIFLGTHLGNDPDLLLEPEHFQKVIQSLDWEKIIQ